MKKSLLTLASLLVLSTSFSQALRDSVYVKSEIFEVLYSEKLESPVWIKYEVKCPDGKASRAGMNFYTNDSIHTSDDNDYSNNVYDKGHLAPAADFNCNREMLHKTFSYLNCALQNQYLNRGVWRMLEEEERKMSREGNVSVFIRIDFTNQKLTSGATIPSGFYKEIRSKGIKNCYYFKNEKPDLSEFSKYKCDCK
jgi:endonuclease G